VKEERTRDQSTSENTVSLPYCRSTLAVHVSPAQERAGTARELSSAKEPAADDIPE
jgi:hypothetical protein